MEWSESGPLFAITPFAFRASRRELERLCPVAPLGDPKRGGTSRVSGRGREGISYLSSGPAACARCASCPTAGTSTAGGEDEITRLVADWLREALALGA